MTNLTETHDARARLQAISERLNELRDARAQENRRREQLVKEAANDGQPIAEMAESAVRINRLTQEIAEVQGQQVAVLGAIGGDARNYLGGEGDGYELAARELDLRGGVNRVELDGRSFLRRPLASLSVTPSSGLTAPAVHAPFVPYGQDRRALWRVFAQLPLGSDTLAITDYRQTGTRAVTGAVERDPVATSEKAQLDLEIELATDNVKQFAAVVDEVPAKLFDVEPVLIDFLKSEINHQIERALDAHTIDKIGAPGTPAGSVGADLIAQTRNAIAAMRTVGAVPTVLAVNPAQGAELDLTQVGADDLYLFLTRETGGASPLWGLRVVEVPNLVDPIVIDPAMLGRLYVGIGTMLVDPFTGLSTNEVRVRLEIEALFHVRDIHGAWIIASS